MTQDPAFLKEDLKAEIYIVCSILSVLATIAVFARFAARKVRKVGWEADDWLTLLALALLWTLYGLTAACQRYGLGRHVQTVTTDEAVQLRKIGYFFPIVFVLTPPVIKISLLLLYRRIFISRRLFFMIYAVGAVITVWAIAAGAVSIFECTPISASWLGGGHCVDLKLDATAYLIVDILTSFVVWAMPIPMVWKLHLSTGHKIALTIVFLMGLFDCAAAMARLFAATQTLDDPDYTYQQAPEFIWSIVEAAVGIICTCLPTVRTLLIALVPQRLRYLFKSSNSSEPNHKAHYSFPQVATYNEIHDESLHNNNIAIALRSLSQERLPARGIKIVQEFTVEGQNDHSSIDGDEIRPAHTT